MAKSPAFQFYVRDWLSDPQLGMASHQTKGIWIDLLCYMWESPERGIVSGSVQELCRMIGVTEVEFNQFVDEAKRLDFASVTLSNEKVTVKNRRMVREEKERKNNALRQQRFKSNAKGNGKVTTLSSSSSSSSFKTPPISPPDDEKNPNPEIKDFIDYAFSEFQKIYNEPMLIDGKKDGQIVKKLLDTYGLERLKGLWNVFMQSDDPFICQAGRSIGVFKTQVNKLISAGNGGAKPKDPRPKYIQNSDGTWSGKDSEGREIRLSEEEIEKLKESKTGGIITDLAASMDMSSGRGTQ